MASIVVKHRESIWNTDCVGIVVTVNCQGAMGAGIARQCRDRYPAVYARYRAQCIERMWQPGMVSTVRVKENLNEPGSILILAATKDRWMQDSEIEWVKECIQKIAMLQSRENLGIKSIAMPPMGCGHGGLNREDFVDYVRNNYQSTPVNFQLYL